MPEFTMSAALNAALRDALTDDPRVLVYGQDVGRLGGVFRVTDGLQATFGVDRVFDTPIAEAGMVGAAVGLALAGWKAVVEIQFDGFSYPALDQVVSHVAKYRERTRGRVEMPITIRIPSFGGIRGKEHHGESTETYWVHTAGLKVVVPSTALDAYRLLRLAIADPDPVIVLEPKARYWSKEEGELTVDGPGIGVGRVLRDGDACTVVTYGAMVTRCLEAAGVLAGRRHLRAGRGPALVVAARCAAPRSVRAGDGAGGRRARGADDARDGRRDRGARDGGGVRPSGGAGRTRDRLGRARTRPRRSSSTTCPASSASPRPFDGR